MVVVRGEAAKYTAGWRARCETRAYCDGSGHSKRAWPQTTITCIHTITHVCVTTANPSPSNYHVYASPLLPTGRNCGWLRHHTFHLSPCTRLSIPLVSRPVSTCHCHDKDGLQTCLQVAFITAMTYGGGSGDRAEVIDACNDGIILRTLLEPQLGAGAGSRRRGIHTKARTFQ